MALAATCSRLLDSQQTVTSLDSYRFIADLRTATSETCHDVIGLLKHTIKSGPTPMVKLRALGLLHRCVMTANQHILREVTEDVMNLLGRLARHRKETALERRGEDLFGRESMVSYETRTASADFLTILLSSLSAWATRFGQGPDSQPTIFRKVYEELLREGVVFPSGSDVSARPTTAPKLSSAPSLDMDSVTRSLACMEDLLTASNPDKRSLARVADTLKRQGQRLQEYIQNNAGKEGVDIESCLSTNDAVKEMVDRYERMQARNPSEDLVGLEDRGMRASVQEFRTGGLGTTQNELGRLRAEVENLREESQRKDQEIKRIESECRAKQQQIDQFMALCNEKDAQILALQQSLARFAPAPVPQQPPYYNSSEFRSVWFLPEGLLVDSPSLKVKFQLSVQLPRYLIRLLIKNSSGERIEGFCTKPVFQPGEGLNLLINKERQEQPLGPGEVTDREVRGDIVGCFPGAPGIAVTCTYPATLRCMLFLPVTVMVCLEPTTFTPGQAIALWTEYEQMKVIQPFQVLHSGKSIQALAQTLRATGKCQVFTLTEMPILGGNSVLAVSRREGAAVMTKVKVREDGGSLTVKSGDTRLRDCVLSVMALGLVSQL